MYGGDAEEGSEIFQLYVHTIMGLDLEADASGNLTAAPGDADVWFDVVLPETTSQGTQDIESLLEVLIPLLIPSLTDGLGEIPMPEFDDFALTGVTIDLEGSESGYLTLSGDLEE